MVGEKAPSATCGANYCGPKLLPCGMISQPSDIIAVGDANRSEAIVRGSS